MEQSSPATAAAAVHPQVFFGPDPQELPRLVLIPVAVLLAVHEIYSLVLIHVERYPEHFRHTTGVEQIRLATALAEASLAGCLDAGGDGRRSGE
jgi:hypothetical protein